MVHIHSTTENDICLVRLAPWPYRSSLRTHVAVWVKIGQHDLCYPSTVSGSPCQHDCTELPSKGTCTSSRCSWVLYSKYSPVSSAVCRANCHEVTVPLFPFARHCLQIEFQTPTEAMEHILASEWVHFTKSLIDMFRPVGLHCMYALVSLRPAAVHGCNGGSCPWI